MNITVEEKLMYDVMKAIYDSRIPIDFKGSMVLKACLLEAGFSKEIRHTVDIDANWYSDTSPSAEQMCNSLQKALDSNGINFAVTLSRMYGEGRSAGFDLRHKDTDEIVFSMDIDVNRPAVPTQIYSISGVQFRGVTASQMLADKISVISSEKVFRRIKDVVDLYYMSQVIAFDKAEVMHILAESGRKLDTFSGFLYRADTLKHAYDKFRLTGDVEKPPFDEVYHTVKTFIHDVLPERERSRDKER